MVLFCLARTALGAEALGEATATADRGHVVATVAITGEDPFLRMSARSLRVDVEPIPGLGVFTDATWRWGRDGQRREVGWAFGGGVRAHLLPKRPLGASFVLRGAQAGEWLKDGEDILEPARRNRFYGAAVAVLGGDGVHTWAGPGARIELEEDDVALAPLGVIGASLRSQDLVGPGVSRHLHATLGAELHIGTPAGLSVWTGFAF